jgi:recombination protein RecR
LLSPLQGVRPHHLRIEELAKRIESSKVQEIILAIDATLEGDATCLFLRDYLKERFPHLRLMRTASGLPAGSSVEYLDASTLERALQNRLPFDP